MVPRGSSCDLIILSISALGPCLSLMASRDRLRASAIMSLRGLIGESIDRFDWPDSFLSGDIKFFLILE